MSRQELAEAVNAYIWRVHGVEEGLDETDVGRLERGENRWPRTRRREAFRAVLGADTDADLGFYVTRGSPPAICTPPEVGLSDALAGDDSHCGGTRPSGAAPASMTEAQVDDVDPGLVPHWATMLRVLAASHDMFGPRRLHDVVRGELALIRRLRKTADGGIRDGLLQVECRWLEFASWTADNLGDHDAAALWLRLAGSLAEQAGNSAMAAYVLMRQAQQAIDHRDAVRAGALARAARAQSGLGDRDRALCAIRYAEVLALEGEGAASAAALKQAYRLVARADDGGSDGDPATIGRHCVRPYVTAHEGYCQLALGQYRTAVTTLEEVLDDWPSGFRQDEALTRARLALAYVGAGRPAESGAEGSRALALAVETGSARAQRDLDRLTTRLAVHPGLAEAQEFRRAHRAVTGAARRL